MAAISKPRRIAALPSLIGSVTDFGARADGSNCQEAFQAALDRGGSIRIPSGVWVVTGKLFARVAKTRVIWEPGAYVMINPGQLPAVPPYQGGGIPFGNAIDTTADDVQYEGPGGGSAGIFMTGGSLYNAIGFLHVGRGRVSGLLFDGGSVTHTVRDDTFMSAISILKGDYAGPSPTERAEVVVERNIIRNFGQYGINVYGGKVDGIAILFNEIHNIGVPGDAESVGAGIVITRGCRNVRIIGNNCHHNKDRGVFISSAGDAAYNYTIVGNTCSNNGQDGIQIIEQTDLASAPGIGIEGITIVGNTCRENGRHGICVGQYPYTSGGVTTISGYIKGFVIAGNTTSKNGQCGIIVQTSNDPVNRVSQGSVSGNTAFNNVLSDIAIGPNNVGIALGHNAYGVLADYQTYNIALAFVNGFASAYGAPFVQPGYWKDGSGIVHLRGSVGSGTPGLKAFTLPPGYRPEGTIVFGESGIWSIDANGDATMSAGTVWRLEGVSFKAAV